MPLINSLEDDRVKRLKSLTYPGRSPYIRKDINNPGPDSSGQLRARAEDLVRLTNMFLDAPGVKFGVNQALLKSQDGLNARQIAGSVVTNVTTMLKQVPVNGTGTHFSYIDNRADLTYTGNNNAATEALNNGVVGIPTRTSANRAYYDITKDGVTYVAKPNGEYINEKSDTKIPQYSQDGNSSIQIGARITKEGAQGDAVNLLGIGQDLNENIKDLVPVKIRRLGENSTLLVFRGFITNLSDNFTGNWQSTQYVGRMEPFFTYTGFGRTISFNLQIPVFSVHEQEPVYQKLNSLVSYTAPNYVNALAQGTIASLQIGDYITTAGVFNTVGLSYTADVPWGGHEANGGKILPQLINVQISFTPIHDRIPQFTSDGSLPYIGGQAEAKAAQSLAYNPSYEVPDKPMSVLETSPQVAPIKVRQDKRPRKLKKVKGVIEVGDGYFDDIDNVMNTV